MYIPRKFALTAELTADALLKAEFAHRVSQHSTGLLVTPLPLIYDESQHAFVGHVSRANPHWHADGAESVAIFSGPQTYMSPSSYATKSETGKVVPTWSPTRRRVSSSPTGWPPSPTAARTQRAADSPGR